MNVVLGEITTNFNIKNVETPKKPEDTKFKDEFSKTLENKCKLSSKETKKDNFQKPKNEGEEVEEDLNLDISRIKDELKTAGISEEKLKNVNSIEDLEILIKEDLLNTQEADILPQNIISVMETLISNFLNENTTNEELSKLKELVISNVETLINDVNLDNSSKDELNSLLESLSKNFPEDKVHSSLSDSFKQNLKEELTLLVKEAKKALNKFPNKNEVVFENHEVSLSKHANVISNNTNVVLNNTKENKDVFLNLHDGKFSQEESLLKNLSKDSSKDNKITNAVNFINHLKTTVENVQVPAEENIVINKSTFANDILKTVKYMEINNLKDLTVKINPKELGEIIIKVTIEGGIMKANVTAQNKEAFNLLNAHLSELNDKLQQNNIRVQSLNISIYEDTTFFRGQSEHENSGKQQNKKNKSDSPGIQGLDVDEVSSSSEELNNVNLFA
ncbi:flagellar hook-length control protein FliK [Clostridium peptidivorans]|uniref:flagellar hook-length control protein FliK n=1 Tax=Clostridium peptidivorans TaxID=100174 RepID=UPI000BE405ED|nr:flagellar hook-length control protein FliK [Clostridium peptidivorans]